MFVVGSVDDGESVDLSDLKNAAVQKAKAAASMVGNKNNIYIYTYPYTHTHTHMHTHIKLVSAVH